MANFIITHTGHKIDFDAPDPSQFELDDIARALARLPRFAGHTAKASSVAQHSVGVSRIARVLAPEPLKLTAAMEGLMHDAHEAYTGDAPTPFKRAVNSHSAASSAMGGLESYDILQHRLDCAIRKQFCLFQTEPAYIKFADRLALLIEATGPNIGHDLKEWGLGLFKDEHHEALKLIPEKLIAYITIPRTEHRSYADFIGEYNRICNEKQAEIDRLAEVEQVGALTFRRSSGKARA